MNKLLVKLKLKLRQNVDSHDNIIRFYGISDLETGEIETLFFAFKLAIVVEFIHKCGVIYSSRSAFKKLCLYKKKYGLSKCSYVGISSGNKPFCAEKVMTWDLVFDIANGRSSMELLLHIVIYTKNIKT
ncbi:hypothetical protein RCL_jg10950.t1 [Rhizophagus clarus]|uniref:Uncharacterized protein n=1 Tax=Rhizophagus clarus TaxID=94130 RepID=A0A8H3L5F7_9GLOM|nr:hypothetical protein RCL_jg10950.t1 [Rhizophagus clarus]